MNLSNEFSAAPNLGVIAKKWFAGIEKMFEAAGIEMSVKTGVDGAASLLAPAALIAQLIKRENLPADRALRILLLSDDPLTAMDDGMWLAFAADLAGVQSVEIHSTCEEVIHSSLFEPGTRLGLKGCLQTTTESARTQAWDLALWIHPAIEAGKSEAEASLLVALHAAGVPTYACMYNELDALIQSHGLNPKGLEFSWLNGQLASARFGKESVNKFGYATAEVGIEGGWGAVITTLQPASMTSTPDDWRFITLAMSLFRLEGATSAAWSLGEVVAGVSFNQCKPVGLIGNQAVDPGTGLLLTECPTTKVLMAVGHLWAALLQDMPKSNFGLLPWAARVKLSFNSQLTKEDKKRAESVDLLERAFKEGMVEAGIALARGYEGVGTESAKQKADLIYKAIGSKHPMSAYYLAHQSLSQGAEAQFLSLLGECVVAGYVPAITDLGCVMIDCGETGEALRLFTQAMDRGDAEAAFRLGELLIKANDYDAALEKLRTAWSKGHPDALNTAHWLCNEMLKHGLGKSGRLKRELKDIRFAIGKRMRFTNQVERAGK